MSRLLYLLGLIYLLLLVTAHVQAKQQQMFTVLAAAPVGWWLALALQENRNFASADNFSTSITALTAPSLAAVMYWD